MWRGVIAEYERHLDITGATPRITLFEGGTPLLPLERISRIAGSGLRVLAKFEGMNPTGSFKDRGMVVAVAKALERGARAVICASTGNTSASAAAYAAHSGLKCYVLVPKGNIALGKLAQALMYGATVVTVEGNFDQALNAVREIAQRHPVCLVNSLNPDRIEGQKTASFEICDVMGDAPDYLVLPVGNAGNITAYWKGFKEYHAAGGCSKLPILAGFQAEGAAPIVLGHPVEKPETVATAIRIGNPASWQRAVAARDESGGRIDAVSDAEILDAQRLLASSEGVFAEPASCASIAGLLKAAGRGYFTPGSTVVCILTGNGLKDPDEAMRGLPAPIECGPRVEDVEGVLGL
ncbi:MAG: threonine synthase [Firmicutes bacterium]|nr:threonine synthase [Bacillota bacterium]